METLVVTRSYIAQHLRPDAYLRAVRDAFEALAAGKLSIPLVGHVPGAGGALHIKAAAQLTRGALAAIKVNSNFPGNATHDLPTIQGFIAVFDAERGSVLALLDSMEITARRTAAASALAAELLAQPRSERLGIVGCGVQARYHLEALRDLFPISTLLCHDLDRGRADALVDFARKTGIDARVEFSAQEVARNAQILVTCTTSTRPLLDAGDVPAGCFVAAVGADNPGKQELAPSLLCATRVVPDVLVQAATMGDLHHAIAAGVMRETDIHGELADIVAGRVAGRRDERETFVFDSTGSAIEDLASAQLVCDVASADPSVLRVSLSG